MATTTTIDWETLRAEGLEHLQAMSGHLWTDYNIHDPGVTLLELLCYAITDLEQRLSLDIAELVTENTATSTKDHFFSPGSILTVNPVTVNDYRKLLIDLPEVKNAWLEPITGSEPALYYDQDNNALLYDYASGAQRINLNGLYRVYIERDEKATESAALEKVLETLYAHRNLGEDFVEVKIMETETIAVYSDVQIGENADANEVMAQIYYALANTISPPVKQYSLKRMLEKGKTIEEIFTGPLLKNGFIDDAELGSGVKAKELHTSDLIRVMMANPEVKDVRNLFIANRPNPTPREKQEWALVVDPAKALIMEPFNGSKLRLFKDETFCPVNAATVLEKVEALKVAAVREIYDDKAMDLSETLPEIPEALSDYESIAYQLPANYGVGKTGLASTASDARRSQARQLRAYLLFFEQILVNYLKQLDSFKQLFAFRQDRSQLLKSYFTRLLPEEIWQTDFPEIEALLTNDPTETLPFCAAPFKRRNRILDHLLAQFNERFADYVLFGYRYKLQETTKQSDKEAYYLKAKAGFLENYPELSRDRNRAYNYRNGAAASQPTDGLKNLIAAKLGIDLTGASASDSSDAEDFYIIEHILFRPRETVRLDFIGSEKIAESYQPDPYSYQLTFVIPKKAGRFGNSKFKELVYTTIANETPAHVSYTVLEFTATEMSVFTECYQSFLRELAQWQSGKSQQYNRYRKQLMTHLGIGEPKLPVLHLDATDANGTSQLPTNDTAVNQWVDLSGNSHHALAAGDNVAPQYWQPEATALPWLRFGETSGLKIATALFEDDFSMAVVFRTTAQTGGPFFLVSGADAATTSFALGFAADGDVFAKVGTETVTLESEAVSPHLALFRYDSKTREFSLTLDGVMTLTQTVAAKTVLNHNAVIIGQGAPCDLGEVIILDSVLTGTRKSRLEEYLAAKWSIPLSAVSSIAQPALHLDANIAASIKKTDLTNRVSQWQDVSLNQSAVIQKTASLQPLYSPDGIGGVPAFYFNNNVLTLPNPEQRFFKADFTLALVYQADSGGGYLLDGTATESTQNGFAMTIGTKGALTIRGKSDSLKLAATLKTPHLAIVTGQKTVDGKLKVTIGLDGQVATTKVFADPQMFSQGPADLAIGRSRSGNSAFTGKIGEIMIFDQALSVWKRQRLENFLAAKWQIDITGVDSVAAPVLHLDASRQASVQDDTGTLPQEKNLIAKWLDLGDEANDAIQVNFSRRPQYQAAGINGLGAIWFAQESKEPKDPNDLENNYADALNVDRIIQKDFTMMLVFQPDATYYATRNIPVAFNRNTVWTDGVALLDADCSGRYNDFGLSFAKNGSKLVMLGGIGDRVANDHTLQSGELDLAAPHFVTLTREQANGLVKLYADGRLHAQADLRDGVILNDSRTIKIGAFNSGEENAFHGLIGEVIIFDRVLTDQQRQQIEAYLSTKWQIPIVTLPLNTAGLNLHLDAADTASITRDSQQRVSQWADANTQSEIAAVQPVAEYQPVYLEAGSQGTPAIRFNNSCMTVAPALTSDEELTLALVYTALSTGNLYPGWKGGSGLVDHYAAEESDNFGVVITQNSATKSSVLGTRTGGRQIEAECSLNTPHIGIVTRSAADNATKIYLDGRLAVSGDGGPNVSLKQPDEWQLGAIRQLSGETVSNGYYHGELAEMLLFNRVLTPAERQSLEAYWASKWQMDLSGIKGVAKPVLHLDASILATIIDADTGKVAQWLDRNGRSNSAVQVKSDRQPEYRPNVYQELGAIHFNGTKQNCLTLDPVVTDDFTIFIVYRAERAAAAAYMPVTPDSFTVITGERDGEAVLAATIWNHFKNQGYLDADGKVLPAFAPGADDFRLGLDASVLRTIQTKFEQKIGKLLTDAVASKTSLQENGFSGIGGVDEALSQTIWQYLFRANYLNSDGRVLKAAFASKAGDGFSAIIETAVVNVVLAQNWLEGVGLFDGNSPGEPGQLNKRDFGLLVGKDGKLLAGIGVPDEGDYQLSQPAAFGQWHLGVLTRVKDTGETRLYLDGATPARIKVARDVSLKDAKQFTIGAENNGGNYFTGDIGEIVVLDTVPDDTQLATLQDFLARKWGIGL